ncbi:allatostatin protein [Elysia marginata]|uniref:Allatostatin protein n=1 Tax=Elysia marginata TaxID=1093978 RepID=A0AAV4H1A8_9GAST|nr:allatostatin protein [Elysia marginata]
MSCPNLKTLSIVVGFSRNHVEGQRVRLRDSYSDSKNSADEWTRRAVTLRRTAYDAVKADNYNKRADPEADNNNKRADPEADDLDKRTDPEADDYNKRADPEADNNNKRADPEADD